MIYLTDYVLDPHVERDILSDKLVTFSDPAVDKEAVRVLLVWHFAVTKEVLQNYPNLKAVVRYGVGVDNIDLEACEKRGIKVFNNPDYGVDEVSDSAVAMIMALGRNIVAYNEEARSLLRQANSSRPWQENTNPVAKRLSECALGIVGVGRIGSSVARKMLPIVQNIGFYDPFVAAGYEKTLKTQRHDTLEKLLMNSDIVTVHANLSESSRGIINSKFVNHMKKGAILVNTARGGLIDDLDCLGEALATGQLSGIGLDVLPEEPPVYDGSQFLLRKWLQDSDNFRGRLIINPHTSFYSPQSYEEMREKAAKIALHAATNEQELNRVV